MQDKTTVKADSVSPVSASLFRRALNLLFRWCVRVLFLFTIYLTCGRVFMPLLGTQKDNIEDALGEFLGADVQMLSLKGSWFRFSPGFTVSRLFILPDAEDPDSQLSVEQARVRVDLWASLLERQIIFSYIEVEGLQLGMQRSEAGRWQIVGISGSSSQYTDRITDLFLNTPTLVVSESSLLLKTARQNISLHSVFMQLDNQQDSHKLSLQFRVGDNSSPLLAQLQLEGDPRTDYSVSSWLRAPGLSLDQELEALLPATWDVDNFRMTSELWAEFSQSGLGSLQLAMENIDVDARSQEGVHVLLENARFAMSASPGTAQSLPPSGVKFQLSIQDLSFDWFARPWSMPALYAELRDDVEQSLLLQAQQADIAMLADIAATMPLPQAALDALSTLAPSGGLSNLKLLSALSGDYPDKFLLQTNFTDLGVEAWQGAPAGSGLDGYAELNALSGFAEVKARNVSLFLPKLFMQPWQYEALETRVDWSADSDHVTVSSTPIQVNSEHLKGQVQFKLDKYRFSDTDRHAEFNLWVGMDYMDVSIHEQYLPILKQLAPTMEWLNAALQGGRIVDSGFVLRAPAGDNTLAYSTLQSSWYRVHNGVIKFAPQWPAVEVEQAGVLVRDDLADIQGSNARIGGLPVAQVVATLRPAERGSWLSLDASAKAATGAGIEFLRSTPLREYVGNSLDSWDAQGNLNLQVMLGLAIGDNDQENQINVLADSEASELFIREYELPVTALDGMIRYSSEKGLHSDVLQARVFDRAVTIAIDTLDDEKSSSYIQVLTNGSVTVDALAQWPAQPDFVSNVLDFTSGELNYKTEIQIPLAGNEASMPRLKISSDLLGVSSDFPEPFLKTLEQPAPILLDLRFTSSGEELSLKYADFLSGQLILNDQGVERGQLYFGGLNRDFNVRQTDAAASGLLINGQLQRFDYEAWEQVVERMNNNQPGQTGSLQDNLRLIDMNIAALNIFGQELNDINVQLRHHQQAWHIYAMNNTLAGDLVLPDDVQLPWQIELDYLRFPPRDPSAVDDAAELEEEDLLADINPGELPALNFKTDELSIGESNLGSWRFDLRPDASAAVITNLFMQEEASTITGAEEGSGAVLNWSNIDGEYRSEFTGVLAAGDLSQVMPKWGQDSNIISRRARFGGELSWPGSPLAFSLKQASGNIAMSIRDGRFVDISSGSSRLLGVFNFDALVRRLELDFSDLYERGFSYDNIDGELLFEQGVVNTSTPLLITGPSSRLTINGQVDLTAETIAADMQVRIPLGENISLVAGLLGAWPVALITYGASKIFSDQVEEFTTIIYRLEGPWSDPQAGFEAPPPAVAP